MPSATDELRRLLDERGVEWGNIRNDGSESDYLTEWQFENNQDKAIAIEWAVGSGLSVEIRRYHLTPEQAIAATLDKDRDEWRAVALGLFRSLESADLEAAQGWIVADRTLREELAYGDAEAATLPREVDKGEPQGADGHLDQSQVDWLRLMPDVWDGTPPETAREALWYSSLYDEADPDGAYAWRCSACRAFARDYGIEGLPIVRRCPSCGARMTGVRQ